MRHPREGLRTSTIRHDKDLTAKSSALNGLRRQTLSGRSAVASQTISFCNPRGISAAVRHDSFLPETFPFHAVFVCTCISTPLTTGKSTFTSVGSCNRRFAKATSAVKIKRMAGSKVSNNGFSLQHERRLRPSRATWDSRCTTIAQIDTCDACSSQSHDCAALSGP
jgi:hypothetical protein